MTVIYNFKRPKNPSKKNRKKLASGYMMVKLGENKNNGNIMRSQRTAVRLPGNFLIIIP